MREIEKKRYFDKRLQSFQHGTNFSISAQTKLEWKLVQGRDYQLSKQSQVEPRLSTVTQSLFAEALSCKAGRWELVWYEECCRNVEMQRPPINAFRRTFIPSSHLLIFTTCAVSSSSPLRCSLWWVIELWNTVPGPSFRAERFSSLAVVTLFSVFSQVWLTGRKQNI